MLSKGKTSREVKNEERVRLRGYEHYDCLEAIKDLVFLLVHVGVLLFRPWTTDIIKSLSLIRGSQRWVLYHLMRL